MGRREDMWREMVSDYFERNDRPCTEFRIGVEVERIGVDALTGAPLPFEGVQASIRSVIEEYLEQRGGSSVREGLNIVGAKGEWGALSLEPGNQLEWSSLPVTDLPALNEAVSTHLQTLDRIGEQTNVRWLNVGFDPINPLATTQWVPRERYRIMRCRPQQQDEIAIKAMAQTASIQCAFDYRDATDWLRKFQAATALGPLAIALFANSERAEGRLSGYQSYRQYLWNRAHPFRCGMPKLVFDRRFDREMWIDWVCDSPMIFKRDKGGLEPVRGETFRVWADAQEDGSVSVDDWELHLSTIFTMVRSYQYLEIRCADMQPPDRVLAVPAFWCGLLYDETSLNRALEIAQPWCEYTTWKEATESAVLHGLNGQIGGSSLRKVSEEMLDLAAMGLARIHNCDGIAAVLSMRHCR